MIFGKHCIENLTQKGKKKKAWEGPLLTSNKTFLYVGSSGSLSIVTAWGVWFYPIEQSLKLNIEKCPYISIVPMCFENAYPQNIFSYFIFLSGCSSINVCYADMFLTVLPEAYRFHKQLPISFIIHFTFYLHKCRKKDLGEMNAWGLKWGLYSEQRTWKWKAG